MIPQLSISLLSKFFQLRPETCLFFFKLELRTCLRRNPYVLLKRQMVIRSNKRSDIPSRVGICCFISRSFAISDRMDPVSYCRSFSSNENPDESSLSSDELTRGGGCADERKEGIAVPTEGEVTRGKLVRQDTIKELMYRSADSMDVVSLYKARRYAQENTYTSSLLSCFWSPARAFEGAGVEVLDGREATSDTGALDSTAFFCCLFLSYANCIQYNLKPFKIRRNTHHRFGPRCLRCSVNFRHYHGEV